ncbi:MAG: dihydroorotase [Fimbriimonadaceae bacterium]|nr:dihydroorotase [Fimbriimonadaceae bacterium]
MRTIFRGGRILDPSQGMDLVGDVVVENAQIVSCGEATPNPVADIEYDCNGLWIVPGLVDMHVHLREPGEEHRETIRTGTMAAAAGGFTSVCCMPNTSPPLDSSALIDFILDKASSPDSGGVFVAPVGALTKVVDGNRRLTNLSSLRKAGIVAASDEGNPLQDASLMMNAMEYCHQLDIPILCHCEDLTLSVNGSVNDGTVSAVLGLKGIPRTAEEVMVMRNCLLALQTGCRVHILRVSTWGSVELIRQAKFLGAPVTCEVCPHHFSLTEDDIGEFDPNFKTTPPLRSQLDVDMLLQALNDGTIDCIASDHSPYAPHEVNVPFEEAPFGMAGLETSLAATLTFATHPGTITPLETIDKMSTRPAQILGLDAGTLRPSGTALAQITLVDPALEWSFDVHRTFSKGKNSPFDGMKFTGKPVLTYCGSEIYRDAAYDSGRVVGED